MECSESLAVMTASMEVLTESLATSVGTIAEMELAAIPTCDADALGHYSQSFHIAAIFIVLAVSALGVCSTLAGKHCPGFALSPFTIAIGKTAGTGVVLATALVHMLLPAHESLTNPCLPESFTEPYGALAFLLALLAGFAMQTFEFFLARCLLPNQSITVVECTEVNCASEPFTTLPEQPSGEGKAVYEVITHKESSTIVDPVTPVGGQDSDFGIEVQPHTHAHHMSVAVAFMNAISAELAFTIHSVFIGLAIGMTDDAGLTALLVAICFHQFFEGISLGARLTEAPMSFFGDFAFMAVFACSAPLGIAIGVVLVSTSSLALSTVTYIITQGIFDAICAGILLHIGFTMLVTELPKDVKMLSVGKNKSGNAINLSLYSALWLGGGLMAFLGKYL